MIPARDHVRVVCALHRQHGTAVGTSSGSGGTWQAVVAELGGQAALGTDPESAGAAAGGVEIKTCESIPASAGAEAALAALFEKHGVDLVLRVLPGSCSIVRVTALPDVGGGEGSARTAPEQVADALQLIAESDLPSALPGYRRAAGLVQPGRGAAGRRAVGLLTGWPAGGAAVPTIGRSVPEIWVAEPAALAACAHAVGGVERAGSMDGSCVSVICVGAEKTVVRVSRMTGTDLDAAASRVIRETAQAAGLGDAESAWRGTPLMLQPWPTSPRIGGQVRDEKWVQSFGIAAGAILLYANPNPAVHGLANLHEIEPQLRPPVLVRVTRFFARPVIAAAVLTLCAIVAVGLPIGVSYARVKMLEKQVKDERALMSHNAEDERDLAFFRLLGEKRWPMTKLLADIAGACPVGVSLDAVELGVGEQVVLRGNAENSGQITSFRENLGKTRIFSDVATPSTTPGADGVSFTMNAKIPPGAARFNAKPVDDFAAKTLSERMHGENSRPSSKRPGASGSRRDRVGSGGGSRTGGGNNGGGSSRPAAVPSTTTSKEPLVIPPPLTDAQIAKLSALDAMKEWGARRKASTQAGVDEATRKRLTEEAEKARARMQEAKAASGGGRGS